MDSPSPKSDTALGRGTPAAMNSAPQTPTVNSGVSAQMTITLIPFMSSHEAFVRDVTEIVERLEFPIGLGYSGTVARDLRDALDRLRAEAAPRGDEKECPICKAAGGPGVMHCAHQIHAGPSGATGPEKDL